MLHGVKLKTLVLTQMMQASSRSRSARRGPAQKIRVPSAWYCSDARASVASYWSERTDLAFHSTHHFLQFNDANRSQPKEILR